MASTKKKSEKTSKKTSKKTPKKTPKKASKAKRSKPKKPATSSPAPAPAEKDGDLRLIEFMQQLTASVQCGDIIGMVVIPVGKNRVASEVVFQGVTPPSTMALPAIALQQAVLSQATEAARRQMAMQKALDDAKAQGLIEQNP